MPKLGVPCPAAGLLVWMEQSFASLPWLLDNRKGGCTFCSVGQRAGRVRREKHVPIFIATQQSEPTVMKKQNAGWVSHAACTPCC